MNTWYLHHFCSLSCNDLPCDLCIKIHCVQSYFSCVQLFATLWTVAHQTPLSMGFSRQEYWSRWPFPPPGELPDPRTGIQATSPALAGRFLTTSTTWENPKPSQVNINHIWVKPPLLYKNSTTVAESHRTWTGVEWEGVRINQLLLVYSPSIYPLIRTG